MEKLGSTARHALAQAGLKTGAASHFSDSEDGLQQGDSERLLSSTSPSSGDSELTVAGGGVMEREGQRKDDDEACDCVCHDHHYHTPSGRRRRREREMWLRRVTPSRINFFASLFWVLGCVVIWLLFAGDRQTPAHGNFGWSPVVDAGAVEYTEYTFPYFDIDAGQELWNGLPSRAQDVRWFELYNWFARVPNAEAAAMPNGTITIPGDDEHSVVWLSVFHELHCINFLRKLVWYEYYDVHADLLAGRNNMRNHLVHCIDALRKATMCHADVTPIPFWSRPEVKNGEITPIFKIPHTCRNFDAIRDWAQAHPVEHLECGGGGGGDEDEDEDENENTCGTLNAIAMTVPAGEPQPTHWPDPNPAPADTYSEEDKVVLNCGGSVLGWC